MNRGAGLPWVHAIMLLLVALLPALALQTAIPLSARWAALTVQNSGLEGGFWAVVAWLGSPLSAALGRPLGDVLGSATLAGFLLLYTLPVLPGLLIGARMAERSRRW